MSSRRDFLRMLAAAPIAVSAPALAAPSSPQRLLVMVFLYGGNDGYNTFVPYANPLYYRLRPTIAVASDSVLKVTPTHGFHPSLASLMPAWEAKDLALVQGLGYPAHYVYVWARYDGGLRYYHVAGAQRAADRISTERIEHARAQCQRNQEAQCETREHDQRG